MILPSVTAPSAGTATAATARVAQLQALIAQAANPLSPATDAASSSGGTSAPSTDDFASLLSAASSTGADATASGSATTSSDAYSSIINAAATQYGIDPSVLEGLVHQESGFNPDAVSSAGAQGLTQVMPENDAADGITNPFDPTQSIFGGAKQLSEDLSEFNGNVSDALAAYNAGSAAVEQYGGIPPYAQTQNYVSDVLSYANQYAAQDADSGTAAPVSDSTLTGSTT
jgi:soluble lytic murein transglycosylase-like protein